jgi:hypothetical protein
MGHESIMTAKDNPDTRVTAGTTAARCTERDRSELAALVETVFGSAPT